MEETFICNPEIEGKGLSIPFRIQFLESEGMVASHLASGIWRGVE